MGGGVGGEKDNLVNWDVVSEDKKNPPVCCHQKQVQTTWKWMDSNIVIRESSCCLGEIFIKFFILSVLFVGLGWEMGNSVILGSVG